MCTVTLIPVKDSNFILTSNRDEAITRSTLTPDFYVVEGVRMLLPKDAHAGGTWIGISEQNRMVCLLNGGFKNHKRKEKYRQSRGIVVTDMLAAKNILTFLSTYNFKNIEPFTIVMADWQTTMLFFEIVWDGIALHKRVLDGTKVHIWSSSTLYCADMKNKREHWFSSFQKKQLLTSESLLEFHKNAGIGDPHIDLQIDRGVLKTRSITQIVKEDEEISMRYENLQDKSVFNNNFEEMTVQ